ncbi:alpha-L-arabinofuranosidase C-terminal domain-containing protein [Dysgonomonas sp. 520]|uniref:alpha-L-arabinofuranosidase C-terminal domain-containing protein n=1 Tax=Dysgonomonas sp. 520 TaxID=2302931 RepID=UPI0013D4FA29|nr:alpha-L-arabinofuranosidase C-terminal domain-containing protein [Dysgonomonas sp. 520]NDW09741.1 alpha-L-arabinofuranosidase [Dysgonomonas sp. 520]
MRRRLILSVFLVLIASMKMYANEPDFAYIFAYGENGLRFAWSLDKENWLEIGKGYPFVKSDFGRWESQKRMYAPILTRDNDGKWHCLWTLNNDVNAFAYTTSNNLSDWKPQSYPYIGDGNIKGLEIIKAGETYTISWENTKDNGKGFYATTTKNFKHFTPAKSIAQSERVTQRSEITLNGNRLKGTLHKVAWAEIDHLIKTWQLSEYKKRLNNEMMSEDATRFANLKPLEATISINPSKSKPISDMLIGIFFEDINYAADGGIYAELVQNRDFEYTPGDKDGKDKLWNNTKSWNLNGENAIFRIESENPVHENNKHYAVLNIQKTGASLINEGFDGIPLKKGEKYDFSVFSRNIDKKNKTLSIRLSGKNGEVYAAGTIKGTSSEWKKYSIELVSKETVKDARLEIISQTEGTIGLDMISLFPRETFKNRKNGLRKDLAQTLADIKPRFVRFPGGCVAHGDGIDNMYRWKNTIGSLETRKPQRNIWGYHQTMGLGYYEYFQFCEDIGAEPLPILPAGVPCQNSGIGGHGQQGGIPMDEMQDYVQEILDLIEWANGDPSKNKWAKMRAEAGHPKPFDLKYIGIGNEDLIGDVFEERYVMICNAIREKYPEIKIVGTAGPFYEGSDYVEGWRIATEIGLPLIDEHYYNSPGWYIHNQDYYDRYDRNKPKVYLGEYAAHVPGRHNNIETALSEALHLTNIERNGDVVSLTSYAPLLAKEGHTQWNPDLIYFNNTEVKPTVGYYVQRLFGQNSGDEYLPTSLLLSNRGDAVTKRVACSVVSDSETGDVIIKVVNLLPIEVKTAINTDSLKMTTKEIYKTVLSGNPEDKNVLPVESVIDLQNLKEIHLPAYSLTVLRLRKLAVSE